MHCTKCGNKITEMASFCPACGQKIDTVASLKVTVLDHPKRKISNRANGWKVTAIVGLLTLGWVGVVVYNNGYSSAGPSRSHEEVRKELASYTVSEQQAVEALLQALECLRRAERKRQAFDTDKLSCRALCDEAVRLHYEVYEGKKSAEVKATAPVAYALMNMVMGLSIYGPDWEDVYGRDYEKVYGGNLERLRRDIENVRAESKTN